MKKNYLSEEKTFEEIYATSGSIEKLMKEQTTPSSSINFIPSTINNLHTKAYLFEDSDNIRFTSLDLLYQRSQVTKNIALSIDVGMMSLEKIKSVKYSGIRYGATLFYNHFSLRLGKNDFDDFSEIVPTFRYHNRYRSHNYSLEYTRQNALFYTYALPTYKKRIKADHFSISDYKSYKDKTDIWASLEVNHYSNTDTEVTGQFDWRFLYDTLFVENLHYHVAVEGWYTSHTKVSSDFYSPSFSDSTLLRIDPKYIFSKWFSLRGKVGVGYSTKDENTPYKYALWVYGIPYHNLSYSLGCLFSNTARLSNGPNYHYRECEVNLEYRW